MGFLLKFSKNMPQVPGKILQAFFSEKLKQNLIFCVKVA